jgi:hypothetical protein
MTKSSLPKHVVDNRANQLNPLHPAYHQSRGFSPDKAEIAASEQVKQAEESAPKSPSEARTAESESSNHKVGR